MAEIRVDHPLTTVLLPEVTAMPAGGISSHGIHSNSASRKHLRRFTTIEDDSEGEDVIRRPRRQLLSDSDEEMEETKERIASPCKEIPRRVGDSQAHGDLNASKLEEAVQREAMGVESDGDEINVPEKINRPPRRQSGIILSSDGSDTESCDEDPETGLKSGLKTLADEDVAGIQKEKDSDSDVMSSDDEETFNTKKALEEAEHSSGDEALEGGSTSFHTMTGSGKAERASRGDVERMIRERNYRLPCHRAKKRSLDDFLKRRFSSRGSAPVNDEDEVKKFFSSESSSDDDDADADFVPPTTQQPQQDQTQRLLEAVVEKLVPAQENAEESGSVTIKPSEDTDPLKGVEEAASRPTKDEDSERVERSEPSQAEDTESGLVLLIEESEAVPTEVERSEPSQAEDTESSPSLLMEESEAVQTEPTAKPEILQEQKGVSSMPATVETADLKETSSAPKKLTRREKLLNLLKDRLVNTQPVLMTESPDVEVDLNDDEAKKPVRVESFIEDVIHHFQPKQKKPVSIMRLGEAIPDVVTLDGEEAVKLGVPSVNGEIKADPRAILKQALRKRLRAAKVRSKIQSQAEAEAEGNKSDEEEDEEEEKEGVSEDEDSEESEEEEDDVVIRDKPRKKSAFVDDQAEDSDGSDADDESEEDMPQADEKPEDSEDYPLLLLDSEDPEPVVKEPTKKKSLESVTSDDLFDTPDLFRAESVCSTKNSVSSVASSIPPVNKAISKVPSTDAAGGAKAQWRITADGKLAFTTGGTQDSQEKKNCPLRKLLGGSQTDEVVDLAALCSGTFPTQSQNSESQVLQMSEGMTEEMKDAEPLEEENSQPSKRARDEEEDEDDDDDDDFGPGALAKKKRRVCISSDEEDGGDEKPGEKEVEEEAAEESEIDEAEGDAGSVMYDSEENEIPVARFRAKVKNEFFDAEAELSGSDVGSGDENEDDESDAEGIRDLLAPDDEDVPSAAKLRNQIAAMQMKQIRDEDARDIRVLQEMLLEDGDMHSDRQRERRFRWKNVDDADNDDNAPVDEEAGSGGEEEGGAAPMRLARPAAAAPSEEPVEWRAERLEREKWKTEVLKSTDSELMETQFSEDSQISMSANALKVIKKLSSVDESCNSAVLSSDENIAPMFKITRRSFLSSTEDDLKRLADLTKSAATSEAPTHNASKRGNNFVFAHLSPGEIKTKKRQEPKDKAADKAPTARPDRSFQKLADDQKQSSIFKYMS